MTYKKQELHTFRDHLCGVCVAHLFSVLCAVLCSCVLFIFVLCRVCPMFSVSLDYPFLIAPSVFSNVDYSSVFWDSLRFLRPVVCRSAHVLFTLRYLCLFVYGGVQHILVFPNVDLDCNSVCQVSKVCSFNF